MKIELENIFGINEDQINIPFIVEDVPVGVVTDVTDKMITVLLWDRFVTVDKSISFDSPSDNKVVAIHIKHKMSSTEMINSFSFKTDEI